MEFNKIESLLKKVHKFFKIRKTLYKSYGTLVETPRFVVDVDGIDYTISYIIGDDPDSFALELKVCWPVTMDEPNRFDELAFHQDGNFRLDYDRKILFDFDDDSEWLTEEAYFQQRTMVNFGDLDVEYWKRCVKLCHKIHKELIVGVDK